MQTGLAAGAASVTLRVAIVRPNPKVNVVGSHFGQGGAKAGCIKETTKQRLNEKNFSHISCTTH
jgi:hypothetical protein